MKVKLYFIIIAFCSLGQHLFSQYPFQNIRLSPQERAENLVSLLTLEEKIDLLAGYNDFYIHPIERLGIPAFIMADGPLGIASWGIHGRGTAFPATIALASTWDTEMAQEMGNAIGQEWRSRGIHFWLAPGVNMYRASKGARNFEYMGEDPYLSSQIVVPLIQSVQNKGVIATVKHYAANDQEFDRYTVSSEVDERTLHEIYLPPFKAAVQQAGVWAVMTGYNPVNGIWNTQNEYLLNQVLRNKWGFKGMVMSDWGCTYSVDALKAGLDLEMGSKSWFNRERLIPALEQGEITMNDIDKSVRHILLPCISMGFLDRPQLDSTIPIYNQYANKVAHQLAQRGTVLLKNEDLLPLTKPVKIAVIGPNANPSVYTDRAHHSQNIVFGGGGSSKVNPWKVTTLLQGMERVFGEENVLYHEGMSNRFIDRLFRNSKFYTKSGERGLTAVYTNFDGNQKLERTDKQVNFSFWGCPHNNKEIGEQNYTIIWDGFMESPIEGKVRFFVNAQGAYRLYIDDQLVLDKFNSQSFANASVAVAMKAGQEYAIRLEFSQQCLPSEIRLGFAPEIDFTQHPTLDMVRQADVVVFCGGFDATIELEGKDRPFQLPYGQNELIQAIAKVNPNTVVVINAGGGVDMPWEDNVKSILHGWYGGQSGGLAVAEIISGRINPSAKLPISIEKKWEDSPAFNNYDEERKSGKVHYREGIFTGYRHYDENNVTPRFPFGHGLSYTSFRYTNLLTNRSSYNGKDTVHVSVDVTNSGDRKGIEIVQVYVSPDDSKVNRPVKELKAFATVELEPGETKTVQMQLTPESFQYYNERKHDWRTDAGTYSILVGASSKDIRLNKRIRIGGVW